MSKTVGFSDDIVQMAQEVAPTFKFSQFAQVAVREKIDNLLKKDEVEAQ